VFPQFGDGIITGGREIIIARSMEIGLQLVSPKLIGIQDSIKRINEVLDSVYVS